MIEIQDISEDEVETTIRIVRKINHASAYGGDPTLCSSTNNTLKHLRELAKKIRQKNFAKSNS